MASARARTEERTAVVSPEMGTSIQAANRSTAVYAILFTELGALVTRVSFASIVSWTSGVASKR